MSVTSSIEPFASGLSSLAFDLTGGGVVGGFGVGGGVVGGFPVEGGFGAAGFVVAFSSDIDQSRPSVIGLARAGVATGELAAAGSGAAATGSLGVAVGDVAKLNAGRPFSGVATRLLRGGGGGPFGTGNLRVPCAGVAVDDGVAGVGGSGVGSAFGTGAVTGRGVGSLAAVDDDVAIGLSGRVVCGSDALCDSEPDLFAGLSDPDFDAGLSDPDFDAGLGAVFGGIFTAGFGVGVGSGRGTLIFGSVAVFTAALATGGEATLVGSSSLGSSSVTLAMLSVSRSLSLAPSFGLSVIASPPLPAP